MYRRRMTEQLKLEIPFGVALDANNRWVKLSTVMPWEKIEEEYAQNFNGTNGQEAKSSRLAFGALYIQSRLVITDEETVEQIRETPSMQYFCGFETYTTEKPFDSSLMVHFRKRITPEMMKEISEAAFAEEARKAIERDRDDDDNDSVNNNSGNNNSVNDNSGNGDNDSNGDGNTDSSTDNVNATNTKVAKPRGTLLLDATCCPSDIHYPTDVGLLNHARELTERIIDILHKHLSSLDTAKNVTKPRTYRKVARRVYLSYAKKRKNTSVEIRLTIRRQLQYIRRNLDSIAKQVGLGADLGCLPKDLYRKLIVITELYRQQKHMYDKKTHVVEDRIVSISQPYLRPIVRGKTNAPVEFGAKAATVHIGGFSFIINLGYDNFSEAKYLQKSAEEYKRMFGFYPKVIIGDRAYATNSNRNYCSERGIRLSAPKRGRKSEEVKEAERKQLYRDSCQRNAIEGDYGTGKRKYGLALIMTKLYDTTLTAISFGFFVKNMERVLRFLVVLFFNRLEFRGNGCRFSVGSC